MNIEFWFDNLLPWLHKHFDPQNIALFFLRQFIIILFANLPFTSYDWRIMAYAYMEQKKY